MPERSLSSSTDRLVTWLGSCARRHMAYVYQGRRDAPHAGVLLPSTRSHVLEVLLADYKAESQAEKKRGTYRGNSCILRARKPTIL